MRVLVTGATGAVGRQLLPRLVAAGHEVAGLARSDASAELVVRLGGRAVRGDALDGAAVGAAVRDTEPEAIVHMATALAGGLDPRHFGRDFAPTDRLRTEGTRHLLAAGREAGVRVFVAQGFAGWPYARTGGPVKTEADPLDPAPPKPMRAALDALRRMEEEVTGAHWTEGIVLRLGSLYGPGTTLAADPPGEYREALLRRRLPVVGQGRAVWSFLHVEDAAAATVAALANGRRGVYNVADDDPAPVAEWLPAVAAAIGAPPPRRVPRALARLAIGAAGLVLMEEARGASNAKARRELGWAPVWPSWRSGLAAPERAPVAA
jgi:nucleoside-diphosphate-sugar epimerase